MKKAKRTAEQQKRLALQLLEQITRDALELQELFPYSSGENFDAEQIYTLASSLQGKLEERKPRIYCTTYCNKGHYVETGKPVSHECIDIPPDALKAEMDGDFEKAISIMNRKGAL